jgi:folate-dependent phosphoribosylglycinamide formyltransferase PurN
MRIGLLAGRTLSEHNLQVLRPILADRDFEVALVVVDGRPPRSAGEKLIDHIRRGRGGYVLVMAVQKCFAKPAHGMKIEEFCRVHRITCLEIASPYSPHASAEIREHNLDLLVLVSGFGIIRGPLLNVCPKGILSYHHGDMRKYRGMPPGLWELYNGETEIGITVQQIASGLDAGIPVEEKHLPIYPNDTLGTLAARLKAADEGMLYAALKKMANPDFTLAPIEEFGKVYTLPNLRQWVALNTRITCRRMLCRLFPHSAENP